jgi:hypothetical protein
MAVRDRKCFIAGYTVRVSRSPSPEGTEFEDKDKYSQASFHDSCNL